MAALRQHVRAHHRRLTKAGLARSNVDLARQHGHDHLHFGFGLDHFHGPAEARNRGVGLVPGWRDGSDVTLKPPRGAR